MRTQRVVFDAPGIHRGLRGLLAVEWRADQAVHPGWFDASAPFSPLWEMIQTGHGDQLGVGQSCPAASDVR